MPIAALSQRIFFTFHIPSKGDHFSQSWFLVCNPIEVNCHTQRTESHEDDSQFLRGVKRKFSHELDFLRPCRQFWYHDCSLVRFLRLDLMESEESRQIYVIPGIESPMYAHIERKRFDTARSAKSFSVSKCLSWSSR